MKAMPASAKRRARALRHADLGRREVDDDRAGLMASADRMPPSPLITACDRLGRGHADADADWLRSATSAGEAASATPSAFGFSPPSPASRS
jgi:hypothetical protein